MNRCISCSESKKELEKFITKLNTASVANRYLDDLAKIQAA
jgi:hypothetical protein